MKLEKANYGGKDCTNEILSKIKDDKLIIRSDNSIIGDPMVGTKKFLNLLIDGHTFSIEEGETFVYPKTTNDRIGVFYSNNITPTIYPTIDLSLSSIKKASANIADVFTCMWKKHEKNPFIEYIAWTNTSSHLNQLLQIMQLLYNARIVGDYKYVSFLEHDVLYPEGYFDFPDFDEGCVVTNMNYMGMNKKGFQSRNQNDEPFHQMTMRFSDAIKHCERILANALVTNSGLIEPQNLKRLQWNCKNPAVHVNHGYHFTSHCNIYKSGGEKRNNSYWGDFSNYSNLFK